MSVAESKAAPKGKEPTVTVAGTWPQLEVTVPLQVAPLITESSWPVPLKFVPPLVTYTVSVAGSTATASGPPATVTKGGFCPQPEVREALQVAPLMTDTVSLDTSAT